MTQVGAGAPVGLVAPGTPRSSSPGRGAELWRRHGWIAVRLGWSVVSLFAVSVIIFAATMLLPGDAAAVVLGQQATPERTAELRAQLGLDRPPLEQYLGWLSGMTHGDFGSSLLTGRPVSDSLGPRLVNSLTLVVVAALVVLPTAVALGIAAALRPAGLVDGVVNILSIVIAALPEFVVALLLVIVFSTHLLHWLPAVSQTGDGSPMYTTPSALVLPVASLVLGILPYLARQTRASLVEALGSEYVVMAELKGLSRSTVIVRHALRNALVPLIQATGLSLSVMLAGTVIIEFVYQYPGLGSSLASAVAQRDLPVVQAVVMIIALGYIAFSLVADILTVLSTPKLRTR